MKTLERIINARFVKAYFITNIVLANVHIAIVLIYFLMTGNRQPANLFHLLGIHLVFPFLSEDRFLPLSFIAVFVLIVVVAGLSQGVYVQLMRDQKRTINRRD